MCPESEGYPKDFRLAVQSAVGIEGQGEDPRDHGGATQWGISRRFAQALVKRDSAWRERLDFDGNGRVTAGDIRNVSMELAIRIYFEEFWKRFEIDKVGWPAALIALSYFINMPPRDARAILQRALCYAYGQISVDGLMGPETRRALEGVQDRSSQIELCKRLEGAASEHYAELGERQAHFETGWQYRSASALWDAARELKTNVAPTQAA